MIRKIKDFIVPSFLVLLFVVIFFKWFLPLSLSTGDWTYKYPQAISQFFIQPYAWDTAFQNGLGGNTIFLLALNTYFSATTAFLFNTLHVPWIWIEKIVWYWPFLIIAISGTFLLFRKLIANNLLLASIASLIFTTNTYALMITGGGQLGVGMGYAMTPVVLWGFVGILNANSRKEKLIWSIASGLFLSLQLLFDLRLAYVGIVLVGIFYFLSLLCDNFFLRLRETFFYYCVIPPMVLVLVHLFWLMPYVSLGQNPLTNLGEAFTDVGIVQFLSFASFENTISLLHPNWPDNIFGKAYFMRPEFLLIPIIAFASLLLLGKTQKKGTIVALVLIGLFGAFLAKGASAPFGDVYIWLFQKIPGFIMFRDSTKWYVLTAVCYSILIPYVLYVIGLKTKKTHILIILFMLFWAFTIRQSVMGELKGTFSPRDEPREYIELASFISKQPGFFRTLWYPSLHQFSYSSVTHPAVPGGDFLSVYTNSGFLKKMQENGVRTLLDDASIKYVIVPSDTEGKIFTEDRKYSNSKYNVAVEGFMKNPDLKFIKKYGRIAVFENPEYKDHFWTLGGAKVSYLLNSPTSYSLNLSGLKPGDALVFSESFDPGWTATVNGDKIYSQKYSRFNSFKIPEGTNNIEMYYEPQNLVSVLFPISITAVVGMIFVLVWLIRGDKKSRGKK